MNNLWVGLPKGKTHCSPLRLSLADPGRPRYRPSFSVRNAGSVSHSPMQSCPELLGVFVGSMRRVKQEGRCKAHGQRSHLMLDVTRLATLCHRSPKAATRRHLAHVRCHSLPHTSSNHFRRANRSNHPALLRSEECLAHSGDSAGAVKVLGTPPSCPSEKHGRCLKSCRVSPAEAHAMGRCSRTGSASLLLVLAIWSQRPRS